MKLLIVESPTKTKTIGKYLGSEYTVTSSVGHIRDLPKSNKAAIDIEGGFVPHYEISDKKHAVVKELISFGKKADEIYLATDPDREGEAIAWHIAELLREAKIPKSKMRRVTFNEITKPAVIEALKHPGQIDQDLRKAQEARRILDRLVGYDLSGIIWKKVRYGLSAGRVQSPALRILVSREKEIRAFIPDLFWVITADLKGKDSDVLTFTCKDDFKAVLQDYTDEKDKKKREQIIEAAKKKVEHVRRKAEDGKWHITDIKESARKRSPYAPFTTSTLQQAASSRLGFSPSRTMRTAQKLYEAGHITYMRTDSVTLSKDALQTIKKVVTGNYGAKLYELRSYKKRSKNAQEAHEAVRPSDVSKKNAGSTDDQKRLYDLIWARTVSSQMIDANLKNTRITANIKSADIPDFTLTGSQVMVPGWLLADPSARKEDVDLPQFSKGDPLSQKSIDVEQKETSPPSRYSEAGLVKELEARGIGRPSTYASIIKTIQDRGYVEKEARSLKPTDTGEVVSDFLEAHFENYISDTFTAEMEDELDEIARGERDYKKTLEDFYTPFLKDVKSKEKLDKATDLGEADPAMKCPVCQKSMIIKLAKTGRFLSCSTFPDCTGARTIEGKELEGPKETGEDCPKCGPQAKPKAKTHGRLIEREGRFGKFISCNNYPKCKFIKEDPAEVEKKKTGVGCPMCKKGEMMERNGRFGPFYSCTEYPDCKNAIKTKPTGEICAYMRDDRDKLPCGALMMLGTKTIPERCSDKTCPNHRPDKLEKS